MVEVLVSAARSGRHAVESACRLTLRWSGRVKDKVPSSTGCARAAQLNR
jgi:hypothetical protein